MIMARAKKAAGAHRERSRREERREHAGAATELLERQNVSTGTVFSQKSGWDSAEGVSRVEGLVRERTRELEEANAALRASESTLRSFYESAPVMMGVVEVPVDNSDIVHIDANQA